MAKAGRRKWAPGERAALVARAIEMRRAGHGSYEIADELGIGHATAERWTKDVPKPRPAKAISKATRTFERDQIEATRHEKRVNTEYLKEKEPESKWLPDTMPKTAEGYDLDGIFPDDRLVAHASAVAKRYVEDRAAGKLFFGVPTEVVKAQIILGTTLRAWDRSWWESNRDRWEGVRAFTTLGAHELAERIGISPSSLGRYEKGERSPSKSITETMRIAYVAAWENRCHNLDVWLCLHDYIEHLRSQGEDVDDDEFEYNWDQALRWITGVGPDLEHEDEEMTLDHLPSLSHVRSLQPVPEYRDPDEMLFGYLGYAGQSRM